MQGLITNQPRIYDFTNNLAAYHYRFEEQPVHYDNDANCDGESNDSSISLSRGARDFGFSQKVDSSFQVRFYFICEENARRASQNR